MCELSQCPCFCCLFLVTFSIQYPLPIFPSPLLAELMKSLVLQDHFSARTETLILDVEQEDTLTQDSFEREQLLMHKLAEASRVLLAKRLLLSADNSLEEFVSVAYIVAKRVQCIRNYVMLPFCATVARQRVVEVPFVIANSSRHFSKHSIDCQGDGR